jgi:hypothetical protein
MIPLSGLIAKHCDRPAFDKKITLSAKEVCSKKIEKGPRHMVDKVTDAYIATE